LWSSSTFLLVQDVSSASLLHIRFECNSMERRISFLHYLSLRPLDYGHCWLFALFLTVYGCLICINPKDDTHLMGRVMSYMSRMSSSYTFNIYENLCPLEFLQCKTF